jgi:hypothetical protein
MACRERGFYNNVNPDVMKFDWCIREGGGWWASEVNDEIVAVSGIHPFRDGWRIMFRCAQLKQKSGIANLNRLHKQSRPWVDHVPLQMEYIGKDCPLYCTEVERKEDDMSGKMMAAARAVELLSKRGIMEYIDTSIIYNTLQAVWKINTERYFEVYYDGKRPF